MRNFVVVTVRLQVDSVGECIASLIEIWKCIEVLYMFT